MAIVFASVSGIGGREAISNFVHRFIVPRTTSHGEVYRPEYPFQSSSGLVGFRMADLKNWQKLDINVKTSLVTNVEEVDKDTVGS